MKKKNASSFDSGANIVELSQSWMKGRGWTPLSFQSEAWRFYQKGAEGLVNAPTGSGKTYSLLLPALIKASFMPESKGLRIVWITPIRALAKEILQSAQRVIQELQLPITAGIRTGDTSEAERAAQKKSISTITHHHTRKSTFIISIKKCLHHFRQPRFACCRRMARATFIQKRGDAGIGKQSLESHVSILKNLGYKRYYWKFGSGSGGVGAQQARCDCEGCP
jgi:hypothetical protein